MASGPGVKDHPPRQEVALPDYSRNPSVRHENLTRDEEFGAAQVVFQPGKDIDLLPRTYDNKKSQGTIIVGVGGSEKLDAQGLIMGIRRAVRFANARGVTALTFYFSEFRAKAPDISDYELGRILGEQGVLAQYEDDMYQTKKPSKITRINVFSPTVEGARGLRDGEIIGRETNFARDLVNMPPADLTPENFAIAAEQQMEGSKAVVTIMTLSEIKRRGMGLLVEVAKGSKKEPRFIVVEYWGLGKNKGKPTVLIGKGITFDTGGNSAPKPTAVDQYPMHYDMAGGAAVLAAVASLAKMNSPVNVVGLVPMAENNLGSDAALASNKPQAKNGEKVDLRDTDAEGRLILADAATYASEEYEDAESVVTVATLTGSAHISEGVGQTLGITTNGELQSDMDDASEATTGRVDTRKVKKRRDRELEQDLIEKGREGGGDIANVVDKDKGGDAFYGKAFISHFLGDTLRDRHIHLDIAPSAGNTPKNNLGGRASGEPVSTLVGYTERRQKKQS